MLGYIILKANYTEKTKRIPSRNKNSFYLKQKGLSSTDLIP